MLKIEGLYIATVEDNNDPDKTGRVQISIEMFPGWTKEHYPWAKPFALSTGGSADFGTSWIPEKGAKLFVFFANEELKHHPYYIADASFKDLNSANVFEEKVTSKIGRWSSTYPDTKFMTLKNGVTIAASSSEDTPEVAIIHKSGSMLHITKTGSIYAGKDPATMDPVVSTTKLKNYLMTILGNMGGPLFVATAPSADISFPDFFGGMDPSTPTPSTVPPTPPDALVDPT